jgi:hypothetical protein
MGYKQLDQNMTYAKVSLLKSIFFEKSGRKRNPNQTLENSNVSRILLIRVRITEESGAHKQDSWRDPRVKHIKPVRELCFLATLVSDQP